MTGLFYVGMLLFVGAVIGIFGFIGFCKVYWWLQDLKGPTKQKIMDYINKLYNKVEGL